MPPKKEAPKYFNKDHFQETILFLLFLIVLGYLVDRLYYYFTTADFAPYLTLWSEFVAWLKDVWTFIKIFAVAVIGLSLWWIAYSQMRLNNLAKEEEKVYGKEAPTSFLTPTPKDKGNEKWTTVLEHLNSNNPSDWRLAIIEADIMLDELLKIQGYHGDSIGDKLKSVEPGDMNTLDAAWEAHKVRNRIAHSGADFELNEREAKRVVALFESVFKEYQII